MFLSTDTVLAFAAKRNRELSFAYLKENGELLSIAASSGLLMEPVALEHYRSFYDNALETCKFFPQYFRFILAIVLNLEDLGYQGSAGLQICEYVVQEGYLDYETSDTRRLEILTLLARRRKDGAIESAYRQNLIESIDKFIAKPDHFIKFNKPLFYELTHFIFFLTNYGKTKLPLKNSPIECLINVGILALLDDDVDLLSEICICFKFLGEKPPEFWQAYVEKSLGEVECTIETSLTSSIRTTNDEYHVYLMMNWFLALQGMPTFTQKFNNGTPYFSLPQKEQSVLPIISDALYRTRILKTMSVEDCENTVLRLSSENMALLSGALTSTPQTAILLSKYSNGIFNSGNLLLRQS